MRSQKVKYGTYICKHKEATTKLKNTLCPEKQVEKAKYVVTCQEYQCPYKHVIKQFIKPPLHSPFGGKGETLNCCCGCCCCCCWNIGWGGTGLSTRGLGPYPADPCIFKIVTSMSRWRGWRAGFANCWYRCWVVISPRFKPS